VSDDEALLARARSSLDEKIRQGKYPPALRAALAEPLDIRPEPSFAAGIAWREAVRTASVGVDAPRGSARPFVGPLVTVLKRSVHRGLRWYLPPVAEQVARHNQAVIDVLAEHNRQITALRADLERLRRRVAALEARDRPGQEDGG
jgi:hypothetical protein